MCSVFCRLSASFLSFFKKIIGMAFKIKEDHWMVLMDFMEEHTDLARGRLSVANAKEQFKNLWARLAHKLNAIGLGERSTEKWQKTWTDYKCNLRKKAAEIKLHQNQTGGGPELEKKLTEFDLRALNIIGHSSYEGTGVLEKGLEYVSQPTKSQLPSSENREDSTWSASQDSQLNRAGTSKRALEEEDSNISLYTEDHDYRSLPPKLPKKQKKDTKENCDMFNQTLLHMKRLEDIIDTKLSTINDTLDRHLSVISQNLQKLNKRRDNM